MKTSTKVILGIVGGFVLACIAFAASIYTGLTYVSYTMTEGSKRVARVYAAGAEFGRTTDNQGCIEKTMNLEGEIAENFDFRGMFVRECLSESRPTPNFCDGVPPPLKDPNWANVECQKIGRDTPLCHAAYSGKTWFCDKRNKK